MIASNELEAYFRVNSLFFDPNIYGRFLALVMLGLATVLLWERRPRTVWLATAALVVLWGGLLLTLSQSSFAALLCGLCVLAALRFPLAKVVPVVVAAAAIGLVVVIAFQSELRLDLGSSSSLDDATSGRYELIRGGIDLALDRPVWGFGSGSFADEYLAHGFGARSDAVSASHTIPLTVAAEQGLIGLLVYLALLAAALSRLLSGRARRPGAGVHRGRLRRRRRAHVDVRGVPGGPGDVDAARGRRGAGARAAAPAAAGVRGRARSRAGPSRSRAAPSAPTPGVGRRRSPRSRRKSVPGSGPASAHTSASGWRSTSAAASGSCCSSNTPSARGCPGSFMRLAWRRATTLAIARLSGIRGGSIGQRAGRGEQLLDRLAQRVALERLRQQQDQQRGTEVAGVGLHAPDVSRAGARRGPRLKSAAASARPSPRPGTAWRARGGGSGARRARGRRAPARCGRRTSTP